MEPEDLPWPGELEEEEEEEEKGEEEEEEEVEEDESAAAIEEAEEAVEARTSEETVRMEEFEEAGPEVDLDFYSESPPRESADEEEDEMAKVWLEAHPGHSVRLFPPPPSPRHLYAPVEHLSKTEVVPVTCPVWQPSAYQDQTCAQFSNSSTVSLETAVQWGSGEDERAGSWHHLPQERDSSQTLDTSQTGTGRREGAEVTELPSLEEGGLAQSQRPVKEPKLDLLCSPLLVIQDNFAAPDLPLLTCLTQDQEFEPDSLLQQSELEFAPLRSISNKSEDPEWLARPSEVSEALIQATSETSSDLVNSCLSISQHPLTGSTTFGSQRSLFPSEQENGGENVPPRAPEEPKSPDNSAHYNVLYSYMSWQTDKDTQQPEGSLADKDQVSTSTLSDVSDESIAAKRNSAFDASCSRVQYWQQEALQQTEACVARGDQAAFPCEVTPPPSKMPYSFLRCMLERAKGAFLTSGHHREDACLRDSAEDEMSEKNDSLEDYEGNEDLQKELSQFFKQKETRNNLAYSQVHARSSEIKCSGTVAIHNSHKQVSEAHVLSRGLDISNVEGSGGPLRTGKSSLDETSEQRHFEEERSQKAAFGEKSVDATKNVAFEAVIASIEPSKQESPISEIQTDKPLADDSQRREPPKPDLSPLNCKDGNSFIGKLKHPKYQSTPRVFEPADSKPLSHKEDASSLCWYPDFKSPPNAAQNMLSKPVSVIAEASSSPLREKAYNQAVGLGETQPPSFQCNINNLGLTEKVGSSNINFAMKVSTWGLQDLKQQIFEEVADSSGFNLGDISKGGKAAITQSKLKSDTTNTLGDSDIGTYSSLFLKDLSQFAVVRGGSLSEEAPKASAHVGPAAPDTGPSPVISTTYSQRENPNLLYQEGLPDSYRFGQELRVSAFPGQADQKNCLSTVTPTLYSQRETTDIFYYQALTAGHLPEETPKAPATPRPTDQKFDGSASASTPYTYTVLCQQEVAEHRLREESMQGSALTGSAVQNTGITALASTSYSYGEKPQTLYHQALPESCLSQQTWKVPAAPGSVDQKIGAAGVPSPYSHGTKPVSFPQDGLPERRLIEEPWKVTLAPRPAGQKPEMPTMSYYSKGVNPVFYQRPLSDSLGKKPLDVAAVSGPAETAWSLAATVDSQLHKEAANAFLQPTLSDSHLTEETLPVSVIPGRGDQKTPLSSESSLAYSHREKNLPEDVKVSTDSGAAGKRADSPTVSSSIYQHRKDPYPQELPGGHGPAETQRVAELKSEVFHPCGEMPRVFYQQELPESHSTEKSTKTFIPGLADQKPDLSAVPLASSSRAEKLIFSSQLILPASQLPEDAFRTTSVSMSPDELSGTSAVTSAFYSYKERPSIHQQRFPGSHLTEEAQIVSGTTEAVGWKTGAPTVTSTSCSQKGKPSVPYQQAVPGAPLSGEALQASAAPRPVDYNIATLSPRSISQREKPGVFYQQALPGGYFPGKSATVAAAPGLPDENTRTLTKSASPCPPGEQSLTFSQPGLPASTLKAERLKMAAAVSGPTEQKTGTPAGPSGSLSVGEKSSIFYQQALSDGYLPKEASPGPAAPTAGEPPVYSTFREKPIIIYHQSLSDSQLAKEDHKVSVSEPADQMTDEPPEYSVIYSFREKPIIIYHQSLSDSQLTKEDHKVSVSEPADQTTDEPPEYSTNYSFREKPIIIYHQSLSDSQLTKEDHKGPVSEPADQTTGPPLLTPLLYSSPENMLASHHQELPDSDLTENTKKVSVVPGPTDHKTGIPTVPSTSHSHEEKPTVSYQQDLPDLTEEALEILGVPGVVVPSSRDESALLSYQQKVGGLSQVPLKAAAFGSTDEKPGAQIISTSRREKPCPHPQELPSTAGDAAGASVCPAPVVQKGGKTTEPPQELPASHLTEGTVKVSAASASGAQRPGTPAGPSSCHFHRENFSDFCQKASPGCDLTENSLKASTVPGQSDQNRRPAVSSCSHSLKDKHGTSAADLPDDQKTELPTVTHRPCLHRDKPVIPTVNRQGDQKTPLPTGFHGSCAQKVKPVNTVQKQLSDSDQSGDIPKVSTVSEPTAVKACVPVPLCDSYSHREKSDTFHPQELPDRHLTEDDLKVSSGLDQADQISDLPTVLPGIYSHSEKHQLVSEHVQELIDNLNSPESCASANSMPLNSQTDDGVTICKPESSGFGDVGYEIRDIDHGSKTLKEIQTLLMEAENIALKRCNFSAPLVPFRDVSFIQSKKMVCFKEPSTTDVCTQRGPFTEEIPRTDCAQKDIGTQTNLKCQRGVENWEFISSTTIRNPLQEAEGTARVALDETFRHYETARSVMRSEPEGCSTGIRNKIIIPMMTFIKSDSSSDVSDGCCSWDSNLPETLDSVSDVFLNLFPYTSPKTSVTDSKEEEGLSESEDGCGSVDSLAAHVKCLLQCESSLNQAKQILRNAEEEECRVRARARAWNLKFNLEHDCGHSISELNEADRRKVEEIKAKLFGHGGATRLSEGLQSPRGVGSVPEAVCGHIIFESHEKGCFRTLTAEQPRPDSRHSVFRSVEPSDLTRGHRSPTSWRGRHTNLSTSIDQSNPHFKVGNSFQLQSHLPFQNLAPNDIKISKSIGMPFHANMDPQPSELVEPTCVPAKEMDFPSSSEILSPDPKKQFTTSVTFSSHRHSYISDSSVFKVGVPAGSQCTGPTLGVFKPHTPEEQISPRSLKQKTSHSSLKRQSHSPVTILAEGSKQRQKLPLDFEHSHQKEKLLKRSDFKVSHSESSVSTDFRGFRRVQFSDTDTSISQDNLSSALGVREKNVTITPDLPSCIFLKQQELFEQSHTPYTDHLMEKYPSAFCPDIAPCIFLEQRELFEQSRAPHVDREVREDPAFFPECQDYIVADLPSPDFLYQQQCRPPDVDGRVREEQQCLLSHGQDCAVEKTPHTPQSCFYNINVEAKVSNIPQSGPDHCAAVSPPPSNRKALSCVCITLCPKTPSKLHSETLDERFHSLDPASKTKINSEFNADLRTISSRSLEPTSKLLTCKPVAQDQESLGFLGPKSRLDLQVAQSSLPASKTISQDLKTKPPQNRQIVTSRQTQVNISDLEEYSKPEGTPVSADGLQEQSKAPFAMSSGKLSSDAVTQITTESPKKTTFSSEIFINAGDHGREALDPIEQKPSKFTASSSVQQITASQDKHAQPELLPYKPSGISRMYYVPHLKTVSSCLDSKSDSTIESSHSGSNDAIAPAFPPQVLGTRDDDLSGTVNIKHTEGIYSKRAAAKGKTPSQKDTSSITVQVRKTENLPDTKSIKQEEEIHVKRTIPQELCPEKDGSLEIDISESECHSAFENTTHSVFRSAKFYFHHPVHLPHEQDFCPESLGRSVFMQHSWKDFFHHHSKHNCLPPPGPSVDKTKMDYTRIKSLSINLNLEGNEKMRTAKDQARNPKGQRQPDDQSRDKSVTPELRTQCTVTLNQLWNKYQERQKQQKEPGDCDKEELSLVERLDRLAKLLQNPITHSLQASESTRDDSRGGLGVRALTGRRQHQQKNKQQRKWSKSLARGQSAGDVRKGRVLSSHHSGKSSQIKIDQIKLDKYILRNRPDFNYVTNTSSDSRPSEESELLTDSPNIFSSTTSPVDSDILTQTDRDVTLNERSSSISTIDTARLIQAFGHERLYLSPRQIKLYSSVTNKQRRYLQKRCKHTRMAVNTGCPQVTAEHTRRRRIQVTKPMVSSDSFSSADSFLSLDSTLFNEGNVHKLNKSVQAGNLEIVTGAKKYTRDFGMTFPTPNSSEARLEEDSDVTYGPEENAKEKKFLINYLQAKNLRKNKPNPHEGVSWFVPVENGKSGSKKENVPKIYSSGISWFEPVTKTKPWREPLREQNWQEKISPGSQGGPGPGRESGLVFLRPFVRATLQEALQLHRPDFISRSGERIKRLKLLVQERKLQNLFQNEREALFNAVRPLPRRVCLAIQKNKPIGKKEMIQRTKRIYEQLPEVTKKREEEKRKSDYKSYRLRAQNYKMKVTNQLLGRKVPWD